MATALENQLENLRLRFQGSGAGQFFRWWSEELKQLLPPELKARMQYARRRVVMKVKGGELEISFHEADSLHLLEVYTLEQDVRLQQQQIKHLLAERDLLEVARDLLLPPERVLRKEVVMPIAAEGNLRQALAYEMDRQTPFRASDVYFDYHLLNRDRENSQIRVELLLTRKDSLNEDIGVLTPRGMAPTGVDVEVAGMPVGLNLLPFEMRYRMSNRRSRTNILLGLAVAVLLGIVMLQSLWLREHQLEELVNAIGEVREEAMAVQGIRQHIEDASEAAGFMRNHREESLPTVKVLAEVTRILPDDTFLDRLLIAKGNLQMQGKSDNAQQLIELVNQSGMLNHASFRGPTRLDSRSGKEIFDLNASFTLGEVE